MDLLRQKNAVNDSRYNRSGARKYQVLRYMSMSVAVGPARAASLWRQRNAVCGPSPMDTLAHIFSLVRGAPGSGHQVLWRKLIFYNRPTHCRVPSHVSHTPLATVPLTLAHRILYCPQLLMCPFSSRCPTSIPPPSKWVLHPYCRVACLLVALAYAEERATRIDPPIHET